MFNCESCRFNNTVGHIGMNISNYQPPRHYLLSKIHVEHNKFHHCCPLVLLNTPISFSMFPRIRPHEKYINIEEGDF